MPKPRVGAPSICSKRVAEVPRVTGGQLALTDATVQTTTSGFWTLVGTGVPTSSMSAAMSSTSHAAAVTAGAAYDPWAA
eukprot:11212170-Lingulodinium_polyedra.AAC.1